MSRRGRWTAIVLGILAAAVLAAGALGFRQRLYEEWYLWKLRSADRAESDLAAAKLAELGSARAVEPLLEAIRRENEVATFGGFTMNDWLGLRPMSHALYRIGGKALPSIDGALANEAWADSHKVLTCVRDAIQGKYDSRFSSVIPLTWHYPPLTSP